MKLTTTGFMLAAALALPASMLPVSSASAQVSLGVSVNLGPPPLPVYEQPELPGYGYLWMPGYWAYGPYGYYWVPGAWVLPPAVGLLWTPGYWGWYGGSYRWNGGYWGSQVGFYGGINYGYGYPGRGYYGGRWDHGHFYYNRSAVRVGPHMARYTYSKPVRYENRGQRVSYNGGKGGIALRPTKQQQAWASKRHPGPTSEQTRHREMALKDPAFRYKNNRGKPPVAKPENRSPTRGQVRPGVPRTQPETGPGKPGERPMKRTSSQQPPQRREQNVRPDQSKPRKPPPAAPRANTSYTRVTPVQEPRQARQPPKDVHRVAPSIKSKQPVKKKDDKKRPPPQ
ncbi:MAG: hypothetical protein WCB49_05270 [Gammaproteobacteria bacterium]